MTERIAIVGIACRYPDARSATELWENSLAQRRAFRRMPDARLRLDDYYSAERGAPERTYSTQASVLTRYAFDRSRFRVAGSTYRQTDLAHWLTLEIANEALADAGFCDGRGLPRDTTGVLIGNSLTSEFSRAHMLRMRFPYVRRVLDAVLRTDGRSPAERAAMLARVESLFMAPFAEVGPDTLAGGLSNTIAGRICNYFDLHGGGYTLDGACASSLIAIANACSNLAAGELDVALAGGVDLSIDPFEILGFAQIGALAADTMRVFDARSDGFWPGEGAAVLVLMRHADALAQGRPIHAIICGWGISSDGKGGMTRPEVGGQRLALSRAYHRAGYDIRSIGYFEGHGTGTAVGDAIELTALVQALSGAGTPGDFVPVVGSIKAIHGHTKAAAGVCGLIHATMALKSQVLPPTAGASALHPVLHRSTRFLRTLTDGESWPATRPLRAGVSAMGFGGINTHVTIEAPKCPRRRCLATREQILLGSVQDTEVFFFDGPDTTALLARVERVRGFATLLSLAELGDLAAHLAVLLCGHARRAAVLAASPAQLTQRLDELRGRLIAEQGSHLDIEGGVFVGHSMVDPRIGFLFPGQGSPAHLQGGLWRRRFEAVRELYARVGLPSEADESETSIAQPAVVTASLAGLTVLAQLGITACAAAGHSLGELSGLYWAGALDEEQLVSLAWTRGRVMSEFSSPGGAMAAISAAPAAVLRLLDGTGAVIACFNSPQSTVVAGPAADIAVVLARASAHQLGAVRLPVSHAFHSPLVAGAVSALGAYLDSLALAPLTRALASTVTGGFLRPEAELRGLLLRQLTEAVQFVEAARAVSERVSLLIEVGPGRALGTLAGKFLTTPVVSIDAGGASLTGLFTALAASWVIGGAARPSALFADRFHRFIDLDFRLDVLVNPCEAATAASPELPPVVPPQSQPEAVPPTAESSPGPHSVVPTPAPDAQSPESPIDLVRRLISRRVELPSGAILDNHRLLSDLHLNSIVVGELVNEAARSLSLARPSAPTEFADATVAELAATLGELQRLEGKAATAEPMRTAAGAESWVRAFTVRQVSSPLSSRLPIAAPAEVADRSSGRWSIVVPPGHPLATEFAPAFAAGVPGPGRLVCLPEEPNEADLNPLLAAMHEALADPGPSRFVLVQHRRGAAGLLRTLHLEAPRIATLLVDVPFTVPMAAAQIAREAAELEGHREVQLDANGGRFVPRLTLFHPVGRPAGSGSSYGLAETDVLLVTGGGKGITAECAAAVARWTGASLVLLGRSDPDTDPELAKNLARMQAAGACVRYFAADVTDREAVRAAVRAAEAALGPITAFFHGAARNVPALISELDAATLQATLAPKVHGARNVLDALDPERLRLLVSFGSIIARSGLRGEGDYAVANEWLTELTERWQREHPRCRCYALEWSIWAGAGMGERLGALDRMSRAGISPIPIEAGIEVLKRILAQPKDSAGPVALVVTGRYGEVPTLQLEPRALPLRRFVDNVRYHVPGVELVADSELSVDTDPYLNDHLIHGQRLVPAVVGMEAMAQVAMALREREQLPSFEAAEFQRPIVVPADGSLTLRVAIVLRSPDEAMAVIRASDTDFQVDCFRALLRFDSPPADLSADEEAWWTHLPPPVPLTTTDELYGPLLFHSGRFRRVSGYRQIRARQCIAALTGDAGEPWFGGYLPTTLVLGDPALRDAVIHVNQVCVPQSLLLPRSVARVSWGRLDREVAGTLWVRGVEVARDRNTHTYDVELRYADGSLRERWQGLCLQTLAGEVFRGPWPAGVLGAYLERCLMTWMPHARIAVVVEPGDDRPTRRARALERLLPGVEVHRRLDGKPEAEGVGGLSLSHTKSLTLALCGFTEVAGDLEPITTRTEAAWAELLGRERMSLARRIVREAKEELDRAATRTWAASECLRKAGALPGGALQITEVLPDGWVELASDNWRIRTAVVGLRDPACSLAIALLVKADS